MTARRSTVVLLSGGLDSATVLALEHVAGHAIHGLTFRYGQSHAIELDAARKLARHYTIDSHLVLDLDPTIFGGSVLTGGDRRFGPVTAPPAYTPARNTLFLAHALARAEVVGARRIVFGANADDAAGYPDCREAYIDAFDAVASIATHAEPSDRIRVCAPLVRLSKREVVQLARSLGVPVHLTWSCYFPSPTGEPCGTCDACKLRAHAGA